VGCCTRVAPVAPAVTTVPCNPFKSIVGLIVVLIVIEFLCGILNGGCGRFGALD